jgi:7,8-dihydropterin-6-yl-methyl-4-(beta-D-ribofuranosyl)aminobenzene 5'-phosphate synthase
MRVTTLIENRGSKADSHLVSEWGLSLHITFNGHGILFDMGTSGSFAKNARHLSVDVASVNTAVLSHHHFDHGGGLRQFLEQNSSANVHLGETPNGDFFAKIFGFVKKYVGLDKALMTDYPDRLETITEPTEILPDVFLLPHILSNYPKPTGNKNLFVRRDNTFTLDDFAHEMVMAIKEDGKLVVFTGCSHNGLLNMVDTVAREFKGVPIKAVIGGFHLVAAPPFNFMAGSKREVEDLGRSILNYPIDKTYTGHCTGTKAFRVLKAVMGERITDIRTGSRFEV